MFWAFRTLRSGSLQCAKKGTRIHWQCGQNVSRAHVPYRRVVVRSSGSLIGSNERCITDLSMPVQARGVNAFTGKGNAIESDGTPRTTVWLRAGWKLPAAPAMNGHRVKSESALIRASSFATRSNDMEHLESGPSHLWQLRFYDTVTDSTSKSLQIH